MVRASKAAASRAPVEPLAATEIDGYEIVEIHRSELKNAPYNPRVIDDTSREKLRRGLEKFKMLQPPVWNVRTGNLVSHHQRLAVLDEMHGTDNYRLKVARVDLDDVREREANILLNNQETMGDFVLTELAELLKTPGLDLDGTGFDRADLFRVFGEDPLAAIDAEGSVDALDAMAANLRKAREAYEAIASKAQSSGDNYYCVVVFKDDEARLAFCTALGLEDNRYQDGRELVRLINKSRPTES